MNSTNIDNSNAPQPSADLAAEADRFWTSPGLTADAVEPPRLDTTPVLGRLGPLPSARPGFPLMGFLATVYEQVAAHAADALREREERI